MKLGKIALVPFAPPGSQALFEAFAMRADGRPGYLLAHHGAVVGGVSLLDSFYGLEELEESCHIAWEVRGRPDNIKTLG
jgi:ribulose-5-phosphate 4-epimerase/fuculose-1-phosphate aldolase